MCGLSGWQIESSLTQKFNPQAETFTRSQNHRGPDSTGAFHSVNGEIYLGHNRLSIIDLSDAANQPMYSACGHAIIVNGEIYNYRVLKSELQEKGHQFTTDSDSEVALKAYLEWGVGFTDKLKGMYAIVIWDTNTETLHLFRDPLGIKPLYYWSIGEGNGVVFASELKSFLSISDFKAQVSLNGVSQFLEFGYSIDPCQTIFTGVKKLQPGHRLEIRNNQASKQIRFYSPELKPNNFLSDDELEKTLFTTLSEVVDQHLIADVPVGLLLSGGLDSSLIAALASQKEKIHTFSMAFADSSFDERPFARKVSQYIGSVHEEILIQPEEVLDSIESAVEHFDDLFADWGMISTRLLYKECAKKNIKVVLVGEGSDELFGGYTIFQESLLHKSRPMEWQLFQLYRRYSGRRYGKHYWQFRAIFKDYLKQCNNDLFSAIRLFETRNQIPNNYVMKVDKASMSVSIEARTPFLDSRVADLAYQIPRDKLIAHNDEKLILKSIAQRYNLLPEEIINRPKFGAGIASNWIEDSPSFRQYARDLILAPNSWVDELDLRDAMQRYFDHGQQGYAFPHSISLFSNLAWRLLLLCLWSKSLGVAS